MQKSNPVNYSIITTSDELSKFVDRWKDPEHVFCDTEFHRERTYYPLLCLIQLNIDNNIYLIDTLSPNIDTSILFDWMFCEEKELIIHAADQDIEVLEQASGYEIKNVFDTQVAAAFVGNREQIALTELIKEYTGITIDKGPQTSNWARRPLSEKQCDYAAYDVAFLPNIYKKLVATLNKEGRLGWFKEEMKERLISINARQTVFELAHKIRLKGASPEAKAKLLRLVAYREEIAKKQNLPRKWVMSDHSLAELAQLNLQRIKDFENLRFWNPHPNSGITPRKILTLIDTIVPLVSDDSYSSKKFPSKDLGDYQLNVEDLATLKVLAKKIEKNSNNDTIRLMKLLLNYKSHHHKVAANLIAGEADIKKLITEPESSCLSYGWKYQVFGKSAVEVLSGKVGIKFLNGHIKLYSLIPSAAENKI